MSSRPTPSLKTEQLDMDSFFDFNAGGSQTSPMIASSSKKDGMSPFDGEERQQFNGPSHDYDQFKQQVGLPISGMQTASMNSNSLFEGFNSGVGEVDFNQSNGGWNSGMEMDAEMAVDFSNSSSMNPLFFGNSNGAQPNAFINPNKVGGNEEPASSVGRLWPGMHSQQAQQAAMQKAAQAHAIQQRQIKLQAQQAQYRQANQASSQQNHATAKRASHVAEPHVEESISRLLNQMRQNIAAPNDDDGSASGLLPHIARMKKDEEDMDEDERLLASDEGKKLSSKERRQLRNKVSARAFRSRRKEYISQLEGEVALKTQEANNLRNDNQALVQENERYRTLIETLLRHQAFTPFINDISQDPSVLGMTQPMPQQRSQQQQQPQAQPQSQQSASHSQSQPQQDIKPDYLKFDASQLQIPQPQGEQQAQQVGLTMVPDNDFSKLNINGFNSMNFSNFSTQPTYTVIDVPVGPDPVDLLACSSVHLSSTATSTSTSCSDSSMNLLLARLDGAVHRMNAS